MLMYVMGRPNSYFHFTLSCGKGHSFAVINIDLMNYCAYCGISNDK